MRRGPKTPSGFFAALIAVAAVAVMGTVGTNLSSTFNTVAGYL
jgi:Flp pilus assembly pilin Flp